MIKTVKRIVGNILNKTPLCPYVQKYRKRDYLYYYKKACERNEIVDKRVLMLSDSRDTLSGNFEFIDRELKNRGYAVDYFLRSSLDVRKTKEERKELCDKMSKAQFVVVDDFYPIVYPMRFREGSKLIQVWHAMGAFKTVGFSRMGKPGGPNPRSLSHRNYDAAICSSEDVRKNYAEAFGISIDKVYATGVPRTDIFFDEQYKINTKEYIYNKYPQLKGKKVIMFAPTFRGNGQKSAHYDFSWIDFEKLKEKLGPEYCFILKIHPFVKNIEEMPNEDDFFINMTEEREINDLLFVTDILITDYSSVIFEASLLDIDTVFFVPDLEEYMASRDFYYPFEDYMFGKEARNTEELIDCIKEPAKDEKKIQKFKTKFCGACDGHSTKRVVDTLF